MKYIKEFDSLRAVAVLMVLFSHSFNHTKALHVIPFGFVGVTFFFVLSGFLITSILFESKSISEIDNAQRLKIFYARRTLRIFPAYYLFLGINYLFNNADLVANPSYFLLYLSNVHFFITGTFAGAVSPTWTLGVEEQFYLIWPFLILFVNQRYLPYMIVSLMAFSPVFRVGTVVLCKWTGQNPALELALMPSNFLPLCLGAYIAYMHKYVPSLTGKYLNKMLPFVAVSLFVLSTLFTKSFVQSLLNQVCITVFSGWLINYIALNTGTTSLSWLRNPVTSFLGKISYGIYLYHTIAVSVIAALFKTTLLETSNDLLEFVISTAAVIAVASASWFLFEGPIHDLKRYFPYTRKGVKKSSLTGLEFERTKKPEMIS